MGEQVRFSFTFCAARVGRPVARLLLLRPDLHLFFASREEFDKKSRWFLITSPNTRSLTLARLIWVVDTSTSPNSPSLNPTTWAFLRKDPSNLNSTDIKSTSGQALSLIAGDNLRRPTVMTTKKWTLKCEKYMLTTKDCPELSMIVK